METIENAANPSNMPSVWLYDWQTVTKCGRLICALSFSLKRIFWCGTKKQTNYNIDAVCTALTDNSMERDEHIARSEKRKPEDNKHQKTCHIQLRHSIHTLHIHIGLARKNAIKSPEYRWIKHQFTGDVMKYLFTRTDCCPSRMLLLLWTILFYIVNANDANWERMTRHNKSVAEYANEYFQRLLFPFSYDFFLLLATLLFVCNNFFFLSLSPSVQFYFCCIVAVIYPVRMCGEIQISNEFALIWSEVSMKAMMTGLKPMNAAHTNDIDDVDIWRLDEHVPFDVMAFLKIV